ncbi:MAG: molybdopterin oxidoreductase family protein [Alphaproteobacteria bacterium]
MPKDGAWSVCPHDCPSACALDIEIEAPWRIGRLRGSDVNPYTAGVICAKVARYAERVHHPDRLLHPLRRKSKKSATATLGDFEPISWDDALDSIAEHLQQAAARHGPETVWLYSYAGTMGLLHRDGISRLRNVMGYSRQKNTICSWVMDQSTKAGIGGRFSVNPLEVAESDLIIVWGTNPVYTQVNLMTLISRARKERGARLVVIDPVHTATAQHADVHLQPYPGTDAALACAIMHVLFRDGHADRDYMAEYTDNPAGLEEHLRTRMPEWAAKITGIPAPDIEALARDYGTTERALIRMGYGFSRSRNGAATLHAVSCLPAVRGAWRHRGGGLYSSTSSTFKIDRSLIDGPEANTRLLDMSQLGPILDGDSEVLGGGPPVTAMFVQTSNPAVVAPESGRVRNGLLRDEMFLAVHEQFLTDTAMLADIVLPATTFLEHDDIYTSYGHTYLQLGPKVIEPVGEARSNHDVICALAKRLGAKHPAFDMNAWEVIDTTLKNSGYPGADELKTTRLFDVGGDFNQTHFLEGFPQPDRRFHFRVDWRSLGDNDGALSELPDYAEIIDRTDTERPFRLITGPSRNYLNSSFTETPTSKKRELRPTLRISRKDCDALGIGDGERVRMGNRNGSLVIHLEADDSLKPGVVVVESVWPNGAFEEGIGINLLTSAEPALPNGGAVFHDTAVWIRKDIGTIV